MVKQTKNKPIIVGCVKCNNFIPLDDSYPVRFLGYVKRPSGDKETLQDVFLCKECYKELFNERQTT